jgi:hypothetical protein
MRFDAKALKKIADACRKAGITHYKCAEFELTISPDAPPSNYKRRQAAKDPSPATADEVIKTDTLTEEQLLLWSSVDPNEHIPV